MSRRKQTAPRHLETEQALAGILQNDDTLDSQSEDEDGGGDEHICGRCRAEFIELADFLGHKKQCARKRLVLIVQDEFGHEVSSDQEDLVSFSSSSYFRDLEYNGDFTHKQRNEDLENNNTVAGAFDKDFEKGSPMDDGEANDTDMATNDKENVPQRVTYNPANHIPHFPLALALQGLSDSNVGLEALHSTKVAVAQFPLNSGSLGSNGISVPTQDVVVLQSTLYTLQQQQLIQLQLIQQLQQQLESTKNPGGNSSGAAPAGQNTGIANCTNNNGNNTPLTSGVSSTSSSSVSSAAMTNISSMAVPSSELNQPNSLELLQRSAQQVLNNASQGLLANGLDFSKGKTSSGNSYDPKNVGSMMGGRTGEEPFFKHRCRFCGKVFGSDSALQIHIRSHTGERPFKCNVCGNRFSTKGNLKVHFQRHKAKYPHIKMNPHPVPEHLDRFHPPLMAQEAPSNPHRPGVPPDHRPLSPLPPQLSRQTPTPTPLDLGQKVPNMAPTLVPTSSHDTNMGLMRGSESPLSMNKPLTPANSEDSRDNSIERSLSPAASMKSYDGDKSPSLTHMDESSKDSVTAKADRETPLPDGSKAIAIPSPTITSRAHLPHLSHPMVTSFSSMLPLGTSTPTTFSTTFSSGHSPLSTLSAASALHMSTLPLTDPALDPAVYTPLLPKPGSNDNSWESLIEITKTSETSKLQQLVDNIEHKLSDPNQCVICHRVLSCKSALQMHYRTHTGERPFKCKICGRAFTTKGNLKTHMGVHRAKPPMRVLHQCPVCHKKFTNSLVLQQHIRMHTGEPTDLSPEQIQAAEIKEYPPTLQPALPHLIPPPPPSSTAGTPPQTAGNSPINLMPSAMMKPSPVPPALMSPGASPGPQMPEARNSESESVIKSSSSLSEGEKSSDGESVAPKSGNEGVHGVPASTIVPTFSTSLAALENHVKAINTSVAASHMSTYTTLMSMAGSTPHHDDSSSQSQTEDSPQNGDKTPEPAPSPFRSPHFEERYSPKSDRGTPIKVESPSPGITPSSAAHSFSTIPSPASVISAVATSESSLSAGALDLTPKTSVITSMASETACSSLPHMTFHGLPLPPHMLNPMSRFTNTTCNICFKTFACHSALEIHYRSHTKERPFKCNACDRAFSTRGNMRQHMLTHKIRDLPPQLFDGKMGHLPASQPGGASSHGHNGGGGGALIVPPSGSSSRDANTSPESLAKRPYPDGEGGLTPIPKRPPGLPKHLCHVCNKNFSSASALQIHMRTHTGDRPFKCTICERAFTTKGNLKVHMGTHMWNNGTSRRGRRMSIDLSPIPLTAKDSEFLQRRPDLYFPFMAAPFMNGLATKVNEISVIQSAAINNGGLTSPPMGLVPTSNPAGVGAVGGDMGPVVRSNVPTPTPSSTPTPAASTTPDLDLSMKKPGSCDDTQQLQLPLPPPPPSHHPMVPPTMKPPASPHGGGSSSGEDQPTDMSKNTSWVWKLACNLCSKVCTSPSELELHLQGHYKAEMKSDGPLNSPRSEANNLTV